MTTLPVDVRSSITRDALAVALAVGVYGLSFGALGVTAGFSVAQVVVLSTIGFTGASQFALVALLGGGSSAASGVSVALLLGARNTLYAVRMTALMRWRGWRRLLGAHLTIDESTAMAMSRPEPAESRFAFWATGAGIWVLWNLSTVAGAAAGGVIRDPERFGLDVAFPAAFLALLAPQLRSRRAVVATLVAVPVALLLVPHVPQGVPLLAAAVCVVPVALWRSRG